ncbi:hypothetical protein OPIT5_22135 [Opitutaceae bacterium TAV5]|nr:hypothetical protein OPIT5_22135 [Opitutaceae bacterium TAV5]
MENFVPGLKDTILSLTVALRVILFFICTAGLMLHVNRARADQDSLTRPLVRGIVIVALISTLPYWFEFTESVFRGIANTVQDGYTEHPMRASELLRNSVADTDTEFSLRRIGESVYKAVLWAAAKFIILTASLLQLPLLLLQYILKLLCFLFLPVALALYMVPSLSSMATRYLQQTLAILAWPIGFAITELVAFHLLTSYVNNLAIAGGVASGTLSPASFASLLGAQLAALWLIIGTLGTPFLMQMLFCSGFPLSSTSGRAAQQVIGQFQQVLALVKTIKTAGAAAPVAAAGAAKSASAAGRSGGGASPPPPSSPPSSPPASSSLSSSRSPFVTPQDAFPRSTDPYGDGHASSLIARTRVPAPQTSI